MVICGYTNGQNEQTSFNSVILQWVILHFSPSFYSCIGMKCVTVCKHIVLKAPTLLPLHGLLFTLFKVLPSCTLSPLCSLETKVTSNSSTCIHTDQPATTDSLHTHPLCMPTRKSTNSLHYSRQPTDQHNDKNYLRNSVYPQNRCVRL